MFIYNLYGSYFVLRLFMKYLKLNLNINVFVGGENIKFYMINFVIMYIW